MTLDFEQKAAPIVVFGYDLRDVAISAILEAFFLSSNLYFDTVNIDGRS